MSAKCIIIARSTRYTLKMPSKPLTRFLGPDFPGALTRMSLGPDHYSGNALMVNLSIPERSLLPNSKDPILHLG